MKHLSKLVINPEKVMTDVELVMLRGGDIGNFYHCACDPDQVIIPYTKEWYGCYVSDYSASSHIDIHCHNGLGSCIQIGNCELGLY